MPGEWNTYATGYREVLFFVPEVTYGTPVHPSPTHAAIIQTASLTLAQERVNRADKTTSRSYQERITHRKEVTWTATLYNLPSGTNGVAPDITDALNAVFGTTRTVPTNVTHGTNVSTTTVLAMAAAQGADYAIGDGIGWVNPAGEVEASFVQSIATDDVTINPPLSAAPAAGATILGSITYKPANQLAWLTITKVLDNIVQVFTGCFANDVTFEFPGTAEGTITIGGMGKTEYASGYSTIPGATLIGDPTITVATGTGKRFNINTRVLISAEGANTDEVVLITGVAGDVLTITRAQAGTAASAHGAGAEVGPYQPTSTTAGSPISGTVGEFIIVGLTGATRALSTAEIQSLTLSMTNNGSLRNNAFGTDSASGFMVQKREVTFSMTLYLRREIVGLYNESKVFTNKEMMIQLGKFSGAVCAAYIDKGEVTIPAVEGGGDEDVAITIEGGGYGSLTGGNDELFVAYI